MSEYLYGIRDGKPVSISDIPVEMAGLKCGCVCPICGRPFQACSLQGKVKRYFRHDYEGKSLDAGNTCNVHWANESGLHKMAKHVIENERKIAVKALEIPLHILKLDLPEEIQKGLPPVFEFKKAEVLECQEVELEQSVGDFKPDVVIKAPDKYLIEIFVSHKVSEEKVIKAAAQDEPMLEIDLSSFVDEPISYEQLREIIVDSFEHREWVFHPDYAKALEAAKKHYMSFLSVQLYFQELEAREQKERKLTRLLKPDNYKNELTRLSNNKAFFQKAIYTAHNDFVFYREHKQVPFFVDIPITGEMIFQCDRRIWQGTIFNRWIYNRKANKKNAILIGDIFKELYTTHKIPVDWDLSCPLYIVDNEQSKKEYDLRKSVVNRYLYYLERL
ncbi:MAG: hypothetical protein J6S00_03725, partial [Clostridia bacterium]|nr:hypothetical protein [Clostridia bacterium]